MAFGKFTKLYNHCHNLILEHLQHLKKKLFTHLMQYIILEKIQT